MAKLCQKTKFKILFSCCLRTSIFKKFPGLVMVCRIIGTGYLNMPSTLKGCDRHVYSRAFAACK